MAASLGSVELEHQPERVVYRDQLLVAGPASNAPSPWGDGRGLLDQHLCRAQVSAQVSGRSGRRSATTSDAIVAKVLVSVLWETLSSGQKQPEWLYGSKGWGFESLPAR